METLTISAPATSQQREWLQTIRERYNNVPECVVPYEHTKRLFDIVVSSTLLFLLFPLFLILSMLVSLSSPGPVFYKSIRMGLHGRPFEFLKFRSMMVDSDTLVLNLKSANEKEGPIFKIRKDPRTTKIGRWMRKFSLDELPQLWNVFLGEMSLVGPRPPLPQEVVEYPERYLARLTVQPGITCYWQISGRSDLTFEEWMELDLKYIKDMNFWTDFKILCKTPLAVITGKGAY